MLKKGIISILVVMLIASSGPVMAQEAVSLPSLLEEARKNNPDILAAKKRVEAAQARIPIEKSWEDPTISLSLEKIPRGTFDVGKTMAEDRMLSFAQFLPLFGKLSLKGKIAFVESRMFAAEYKSKQIEITNKVKNVFYELFMNHQETELSRQSLALLKIVAETAQARYRVGGLPQEDIFKINVEIARLSSTLENLMEERKAVETRLNTLLNRDPEGPLGAPVIDEDISFEPDMKLLYLLTIEKNPELEVFRLVIEKNEFARKLAKKSVFPDIMAQITQRGIASGTIGPWDLMLAFTVPLWFWTKQRYQIKEAIADLDGAKAAYEAMKNTALAETKEQATKIRKSQNQIRLARDNTIPLLENSIGSSLAGFRTGQGDLMMLLDSMRMLVDAKMEYYRALTQYNMDLADLELSVGGNLKEVKP